MKIGIDAHYLEGQRTGVGRYLINLLQQWSRFDLPKELKFILYFKKEIPQDLDLPDSVFAREILKAPFDLQSNAFFIHYLLPRSAKKSHLEVLFCPGYIAPIIYRGKIALTLHDIIYQARPDLYNWPSVFDKILLKKVSRISAQKAEIIFVPSEFSRKEVLKHYKINSNKISVTPLATSGSFASVDDRNKLKEIKNKYQIKNRFILYLGSIFNRRHLPEIIKAFEKIAQELTDEQFLLTGVNHTSPFIDIDKLVKQVNQNLGRQAILQKDYPDDQDLAALYSSADLLIWLSDYEGFGLPILESMACGVPVVTSSGTSIPEVGGRAVIYVQNPSNIDEIYHALHQGLNDEKLRQDLIKKGLEQARKFSWQKCASETLKGLLKLANYE